MKKILILGVGNILYTDEGIGVRAAEYLQTLPQPSETEVMDGGTLGIRLMSAMMDCDKLIVLDAVLGNGAPGALYRLTGEDLRKSLSFRDSMHQTDLVDTLIYCELAGHRPDTVVLGMEPEDYQRMGETLSPCCQARIQQLAELALEECRAFRAREEATAS